MKLCKAPMAMVRNGFSVLGVSLATLIAAAPVFAADKQDGRELNEKLRHIGHIIVIYQENWSFDSLYGRAC